MSTQRPPASTARTFAVYAIDAMPEFVSQRLGCLVHHPVDAGVDLAAVCIRNDND